MPRDPVDLQIDDALWSTFPPAAICDGSFAFSLIDYAILLLVEALCCVVDAVKDVLAWVGPLVAECSQDCLTVSSDDRGVGWVNLRFRFLRR